MIENIPSLLDVNLSCALQLTDQRTYITRKSSHQTANTGLPTFPLLCCRPSRVARFRVASTFSHELVNIFTRIYSSDQHRMQLAGQPAHDERREEEKASQDRRYHQERAAGSFNGRSFVVKLPRHQNGVLQVLLDPRELRRVARGVVYLLFRGFRRHLFDGSDLPSFPAVARRFVEVQAEVGLAVNSIHAGFYLGVYPQS